jgi:hypothetical protein
MPDYDRLREYDCELVRILEWLKEVREGLDTSSRSKLRTTLKEVRDIEVRVTEIQAGLGMVEDEAWAGFVGGHPELTLRPPVSDDDVVAALHSALALWANLDSINAGAVALELYGFPITHSDRVRTGLRLAQLAKDGRVRRLAPTRPSHDTCSWGLCSGGPCAN